jgi:hypothetical protein
MKRRYYTMDFLPALLDLFAIERRVTSKMIAQITGHYQGGDAVVALRDNGLELVVVGFVPGSKQVKLYEWRNQEEFLRSEAGHTRRTNVEARP